MPTIAETAPKQHLETTGYLAIYGDNKKFALKKRPHNSCKTGKEVFESYSRHYGKYSLAQFMLVYGTRLNDPKLLLPGFSAIVAELDAELVKW